MRLERQVGGVRAGSRGSVYALDVAGQRLASACGPAGGLRYEAMKASATERKQAIAAKIKALDS